MLKDDLKALWDYRHVGYAWRFWLEWFQRAIRSRIEPLKLFARRLKERIDGVLAHCRWPLHTSLLEGINNKIKVLKRMAYGFRDDEYFFRKIRAAFPEMREEPKKAADAFASAAHSSWFEAIRPGHLALRLRWAQLPWDRIVHLRPF